MKALELYVPPAEGNPLDTRFLPKTRPDFKFPIQVGTEAENRRLAFWQLFRFWLASFAVTHFFVVPSLEPDFPTSLRGFFLFPLIGVWVVFMLGSRRGDLIFTAVAICIGILFSSLLFQLLGSWPGALTVALLQGMLFYLHYARVALSGMHDIPSRKAFMRFGRLPPGVRRKRRYRAFLDAFLCYLTYNRHSLRWPGVFSGSYRLRMTQLYAAIGFMTIAIAPLLNHSGLPTWCLLVEAPTLVVTLWLAGCLLVSWPRVGAALAMKERQLSPELWLPFLDRLQDSSDPTTAESVLLGFVDYDRSPILYRLADLFRHAWIVGASGSGKTSYLMLLLYQLVYGGKVSTVTIDLKGTSHELLATSQRACREYSKRRGKPRHVQHFTLDDGEATYLFDVFRQAWWASSPAPQRTAVVLSALSISYLAVYGQQYFRDAAYDIVHFVLQRHPDVSSWEDFRKRLQEAIRHAKPWELSPQVRNDAEHVLLIIKRLAAVPALNDYGQLSTEVRDNAIDFAQAFASPQHYHFSLAPGRHRLLAGEVARLILASLLTAGAKLKRRPVGVVLIIDEFQEAATRDLGLLLAQARSLGISVVLANQTTAQLVSPDIDLRPIIEGNTGLQAWMQVSDDIGREQLRRLGGQHVITLRSEHQGGSNGTTYSITEHIQDRVSGNLVSAVSSDPRRCFIRLTSNSGYACYGDLLFAARTFYHQSKDDYDDACNLPWPAATHETLINGATPPSSPPPPTTFPTIMPPPGNNSPRSNRLGRSQP